MKTESGGMCLEVKEHPGLLTATKTLEGDVEQTLAESFQNKLVLSTP